ncbi:hypothetical protein AMTR_s00180p00044050 [Amborella trichopoda]|uniref:Uncharacterized protein n=1 Tax=Amborella trichopoda TaxID=13333 RepID=W1PS41_AMBTC|nr:hypothetical protein AMTR_s00180p00044050 [Amborella trichopoda]
MGHLLRRGPADLLSRESPFPNMSASRSPGNVFEKRDGVSFPVSMALSRQNKQSEQTLSPKRRSNSGERLRFHGTHRDFENGRHVTCICLLDMFYED